MDRVLLVKKVSHDVAPIVCLKVLQFDKAAGLIEVEGQFGHRWKMTIAYAKEHYDRYIQPLTAGHQPRTVQQEFEHAKLAGVREGLQAGA